MPRERPVLRHKLDAADDMVVELVVDWVIGVVPELITNAAAATRRDR